MSVEDHEPISARRAEQVATARQELLEGLARLDVSLDQVLSTYLATEARAQDVLYRDVLWRAPMEQRVLILNRLLDEDGVADAYPFLEHLPEMVDVRNVVAHMVLDTFASTDELLVFNGRRRGDDKRREVRPDRLEGLAALTSNLGLELWRLLDDVADRRGLSAPEPAPERPEGDR